MERLWAPWRMEYITEEPRPGCLFCRVINDPGDQDAALAVWRPEGAIVLLNKYPYNPGHVMVAPHAHVGNLEDLDETQSADLMRALQRATSVLKKALKPEGFNVGANIGRVAGAGMPDHVHLHVVPRWNGDTNFMPVLGEVKVINEHLAQTAAKLSEAFASS
ncbi:MAG TPA: HIT domain-containing protein [Candidatus Dormibacteraeota bacterium]|jgi:ATP adenylyltransferase|nr:HIT domain-containing protein [Candidatus Dormibacteraeota bacterium]